MSTEHLDTPEGTGMDSFDVYDLINAPQFVNFDHLRQGLLDDIQEADHFFNNHREEDDYFVPVENLSPSIQCLNLIESNKDGNTKCVKTEMTSQLPKGLVLTDNDNLQFQRSTSSFKSPLDIDENTEEYTFGPLETQNDKDEKRGKENSDPISMSPNVLSKIIQEKDANQQNSPDESCLRCSLVAQLENLNLNTTGDSLKDEEEDVLIIDEGGVVFESESNDKSQSEIKVTSEDLGGANVNLNNLEYEGREDDISSDETTVDLNFQEKSTSPSQTMLSGVCSLNDLTQLESMNIMLSAETDQKWNEADRELKSGDVASLRNCPEVIAEPEVCFFDFESHILSGSVLNRSPHSIMNLRRVSSCNDLVKAVEPLERKFKAYGYVPHVGITVPRTPAKPANQKSSQDLFKASCQLGAKSIIITSTSKICSDQNKQELRSGVGRQSRQSVKPYSYISLAEAVNKFNKEIPGRFHSTSKAPVSLRAVSTSTNSINRRTPSPSVHELYQVAEKSLESLTTLDKKIESNKSRFATNSGNIQGKFIRFNLPKRYEIKTTVPKPFKFHETRHRAKNIPIELEKFDFKAKAVPMKIFQKPELKTKPENDRKIIQEKKSVATTTTGATKTSPIRTVTLSSRPMSASRIPTPRKWQQSDTALVPPVLTVKKPIVRQLSFDEREKEIKGPEIIKASHPIPLPNIPTSLIPKKKVTGPLKQTKEVVGEEPNGKMKTKQDESVTVVTLDNEKVIKKPKQLKPLRAFQIKSSDKLLTIPKSPAFKPLPSQRRILK